MTMLLIHTAAAAFALGAAIVSALNVLLLVVTLGGDR